MRQAASYFKDRAGIFTVFIVFAGIFAVADILFDVPLIALMYPLSLCLLAGIVIAGIDLFMYVRRHNELLKRELPEPRSLLEKDYQLIISKLEEEAEMSRLKASEDYNNAIEYYTIWAHQIKTPIAAMRLALQSEDTESARKLTGDLNRIEAYVEMVLTFLRLDSDSTDYLIKEYDLDSIIKPAVKKFAREFIVKKLKLEYEPVNHTVLTDSKWLSFIIEQVISNAVKYTSSGGVRIYMQEKGILCIEDTGIGISEEDLPRIFENGYTGFNGREDKRASGIGLYLCKRIADNLGHKISAVSKAGEGTVIILDLRTRAVGVE